MNDIYQRFHNLPRGRKGDKVVVIVEEGELARLIGDAQESEGALMARAARAHRASGPMTTITGGAEGGAPMQIHVDGPPPPHADIVRIVEDDRRRRTARQRGW